MPMNAPDDLFDCPHMQAVDTNHSSTIHPGRASAYQDTR